MILIRCKAVAITLTGTILLVFIGLLCLPVYSFLSINIRPASADVLVVEGWLSEETLEKAKEEFLRNHYNLLITTGFPNDDGFRMGSGGAAKFNLQNHIKPASDRLYTITLTCRGTEVNNIFPHVILYADTSRLGDLYSTRGKKEHAFTVSQVFPPKYIRLEFDNDTYTKRQDRDLYLYGVTVNEYYLPANSSQVALYDTDRNGLDSLIKVLGTSTAEIAANHLVKLGIPDSLVVPVETLDKGISKTFASAMDVRQQCSEGSFYGLHSVTVFSEGVHARRSYLSFEKAFGKFTQVGVISNSDQNMTQANWWKSLKGWSTVLYEICGIVYIKVFC